jgi:hypothetical protein
VECFDALRPAYNRFVIIDCVEKAGGKLTNYFYFGDINQTQPYARIKNSQHVDFSALSNRKLHPLNFADLLIRVHLSQSVDSAHSADTYIEVISIADPHGPQVVKVFDKSFFELTELKIIDFDVEYQKVYLLDQASGLIILDLSDIDAPQVIGRYKPDFHVDKLAT